MHQLLRSLCDRFHEAVMILVPLLEGLAWIPGRRLDVGKRGTPVRF